MKILLITSHLRMGGIGVYVVTLAKALKSNGHKVFVASSGGELTQRLRMEQIPHIAVNLDTKFEFNPRIVSALYKLLWFVLDEEIEIIHTHTRASSVVGHFLSGLTKIPYVSTCHGFFKPRLGRRLFGCWGKRVIAISEAVREHLVNDFKIKKSKIALISNGIDINAFSKYYGPHQIAEIRQNIGLKSGPVVGTVARLSPVKGHKYLINAMKIVIDKKPEAQLLIVGEGPEEDSLRILVEQLGLTDSVAFMDSVIDTTLVLAVMDVFVLPSVAEGLGLALIEALAYKRPVIASDVGGIYSIVKDGITGLLVPPRCVEKLAEVIVKLLEDRELAKRLGENGRRLVEKEFSISQMRDDIEGVYKQVLEE